LQIQKKPAGIMMIPFQQAVSNKISRLLVKHNIKIDRFIDSITHTCPDDGA
jgi:hypothetical protein